MKFTLRQPSLKRRRAALLGIGLSLCSIFVLAQPAAPHTIRLIVPFAAGSYTDNVARIIAPAMAERLGGTVIIENKAGANGIIGANYVAKSPPDGLTFL